MLIGGAVGVLVPFLMSLCLFGSTFQTFLAGPQPTPGYWSGAPTGSPTPVPNPVQVATNTALTSANGVGFLLWSMLGAFAGEGIAVRRFGRDFHATRNAWLGAAAGSILLVLITLFARLVR